MPVANPDQKLEQAVAFLQQPLFRNLHAQAHARAILRQLATPGADWPNFRADLDERLHAAAYHLFWTALQILEAGQQPQAVRPLLVAAAEAWEFLGGDPRFDAPLRVEQ